MLTQQINEIDELEITDKCKRWYWLEHEVGRMEALQGIRKGTTLLGNTKES